MKERPIIFNGDMVRAILDGRKTQTRRLVKKNHVGHIEFMGGSDEEKHEFEFVGLEYGEWQDEKGNTHTPEWLVSCTEYPEEGVVPIGQLLGAVGDRLWVRETWRQFSSSDECGCSESPCSCPPNGTALFKASHDDGESKWKPSIHMPRWACRIILEITNVRVERLQDISKEDAKAEGFDYPPEPNMNFKLGARHNFLFTWDQIYGNSAENPWVWVIEFKVLTTNGQIQQEAA